MTYFISKRKRATESFRIVYREVKTRTRKGNPLRYEMKVLPEEYATWEEAMAAIEKLNAKLQINGRSSGGIWPPLP